jgi:DNA repair protein RadC
MAQPSYGMPLSSPSSSNQKPEIKKMKKYKTTEIKLMTVREIETPADTCDSPLKMMEYWETAITPASWYSPDRECVVVVMLDAKLKAFAHALVSVGTVNQCSVHSRDIFRPAIHMNAVSVAIMHNHPSGDPTPSSADYRITKQVKDAGELLLIPLIDHVVIGKPNVSNAYAGGYFSFREAGCV